jgi:hypothetical protein
VFKLKIVVGSSTFEIRRRNLEEYLSKLYKLPVKLISLKKIGEGFHNAGFLLSFTAGLKEKRVIMRIVRGDTGWGHDYLGDRCAVLLLQHKLFNTAKRGTCCRSIDVAGIMEDGNIVSIGDSKEFFNIVEEVTEADGKPYCDDLFEIAKRRELTERDRRRCRVAADYLADLHKTKKKSSILYMRHIRDLIGHGEMLMGVIDTYPDPASLNFTSRDEMASIELKAVKWRNKIKFMTHRLSRIHGDYHPFGNIRFKEDDSIMALDLARAEFGEPADDVSCISINYIFFSVWHYGGFVSPFKDLFDIFFDRYLERTGDEEIFKVMAPFYAFRGLVVAHPLYYPDMELEKRRMIFNFINNVLDSDEFDRKRVDAYLKKY